MAAGLATQGSLGQRINQARTDAGLAVGDLAVRAGISADQLVSVESGAEVSTHELNAIAMATGRDLDFFLFPDDEVQRVLLRAPNARSEQTQMAIRLLARFVRDYEFLRSLEG